MRRKGTQPYLTRIAVVIAGRDYQIDCSRAAAELGWAARPTTETRSSVLRGCEEPVDLFVPESDNTQPNG